MDVIGEKYGRWLIVREVPNQVQKSYYCTCECGSGKDRVITFSDLKRGNTKSCGCYHKEVVKETSKKHGLRGHRLYSIWASMKTRCYNENSSGYKNYGGRGIIICDEWINEDDGFINFYNWAMNNGYSSELTLDRENVNGNYEPSNCRWSDRVTQANNTRVTKYVEINGEIKTPKEWREIYNLSRSTFKWRISKGWDIVKTLTTPVRKKVSK
jgi:hypothetical protein